MQHIADGPTGSPTRRPARRHGAPRAAPFLALGAALALAAVACDRLVTVAAPSRVIASSLYDPVNAQLLMNGASSDFECAFGQYIVAQGLVGNELEVATGLI